MRLTRRKVLGTLAAGSCMLTSCMRKEMKNACRPDVEGDGVVWPYHELDPEATAERAYLYHYEGSCMYGVFKSIVGQLAERYGEPYRSFPCGMMTYGAGGVAGWGSLCGALNGASAVIGLFASGKERQASLAGQVLRWYEQTELPVHVPARPKLDMTMATSAAGSVLCHLSVGAWSRASGYPVKGKERSERCARLTADTARRTVIVLNEGVLGGVTRSMLTDTHVAQCNACHGPKSERKDVSAAMTCGGCHSSLPDTHPRISLKPFKPV